MQGGETRIFIRLQVFDSNRMVHELVGTVPGKQSAAQALDEFLDTDPVHGSYYAENPWSRPAGINYYPAESAA